MHAFSHGEAWVRVDPRGQIVRAEIATTVGGALLPSVARSLEGFVPAFALIAKAKRFDDRFVAAMDRVGHDGLGGRSGWRRLLAALRPRLTGAPRALIEAARFFMGDEAVADGPERLAMRKLVRDFERDPRRSRPIGIYSESDELSRIFKHDRMLQSELLPPVAQQLAGALGSEAEAYRLLVRLAEIVTGPRAIGSVEDADAEAWALLPPSDSHEGRLVKELFGRRQVPDGFRLIEELIVRVRDGRIDMKPRPEDGWYAHKQWAMAALLAPETAGLEIGPKYRKALEEAFAALFTLTRETHVKQLQGVAAGPRPLVIAPRFSVEPLPELYARTGAAYRFVRSALTALVGEPELRSAQVDRLDAFDALIEMESIFLGAEATARAELGQAETDVALRARFAAFARDAGNDPDLEVDLRVAVPLYEDPIARRVRIAAVIGLEPRTLGFSFVTPPKVEVIGSAGEPTFATAAHTILSPVALECDVRVPPTREELRAICDRETSVEAIRSALVAG